MANSILGKSGQTAVPSVIRKEFHLEAGSKLHWETDGSRIIVYPLAKDPIKALIGVLKGHGSVEDLLIERQKDKKRGS